MNFAIVVLKVTFHVSIDLARYLAAFSIFRCDDESNLAAGVSWDGGVSIFNGRAEFGDFMKGRVGWGGWLVG